MTYVVQSEPTLRMWPWLDMGRLHILWVICAPQTTKGEPIFFNLDLPLSCGHQSAIVVTSFFIPASLIFLVMTVLSLFDKPLHGCLNLQKGDDNSATLIWFTQLLLMACYWSKVLITWHTLSHVTSGCRDKYKYQEWLVQLA